MKQYDAIIIGSGQAGTPLSKKLAKAGWKTAIIEQRFPGGTCVNDGCTPSKTMAGAARMAYMAKRAQEFGIPSDPSQIDIKKVMDRKNEVVSNSRKILLKGLTETPGLDLLTGTASFTGVKTIEVKYTDGSTDELTAPHIFINTGARPMIPPIKGLQDVSYLTSTSLLDISEKPEHLLILGSGYIAMEFGQMFRRFGSKVTILERAPNILIKEDEDISTAIADILKEDGITIITSAQAREVTQTQGKISLSFEMNGTMQSISGSHLLIGAGRIPNTEALQLSRTGIATDDKGYIIVNERLETNVEGIYALGDVKGGPAFTHISYNDYIIVSQNILEKKHLTTKNRPVPYCMFTDPELGRIGMTEKEAREKGIKIKVAKLPLAKTARGIESGETRGLMKAVVNAETQQILGASILSVSGGEIMSVLQVAMMGHITYEEIRYNAFAHPTFTESLNNLFMTLDND
jgi:pyruvate/2-oxoglutarate dehydrogenase complex dihydrolipoamide dehydrogenase (E3) component